MTTPSQARQATLFMIQHVRDYQAHGTMMIDGVLCRFFSQEPVGPGDAAHFRLVSKTLKALEASLTKCLERRKRGVGGPL